LRAHPCRFGPFIAQVLASLRVPDGFGSGWRVTTETYPRDTETPVDELIVLSSTDGPEPAWMPLTMPALAGTHSSASLRESSAVITQCSRARRRPGATGSDLQGDGMTVPARSSVRRLRTLVAVTSAMAVLIGGVVWAQSASAATALVYATFKGDAAADEELWIYQSTNGGTSYNVLADTNFRGPTGVLRDPSVIKYNGRYYAAFTVQSWTTSSTYFSIASSTNLVNWTNIATVPSGIANTKYTWAPEFYVEGGVVRLITSVAANNCSNCFRPYVYTAQNTALTSWSGPAQMWGLGFNHIDTFVWKAGSTWHAFTKNETTKYIEHWTTTASLTSGWVNHGTLFSAGYEGPSLVRLDNGQWRIYVDKYTNGGIWTATSSDLWSWSGLSYVNCAGCRHGTAIAK
jgi:hypothetical protein